MTTIKNNRDRGQPHSWSMTYFWFCEVRVIKIFQ